MFKLKQIFNWIFLSKLEYFRKYTPKRERPSICNESTVFVVKDLKDVCPLCNRILVKYPSFNEKVCYNCGLQFDWLLRDNQKSLIQHQR